MVMVCLTISVDVSAYQARAMTEAQQQGFGRLRERLKTVWPLFTKAG